MIYLWVKHRLIFSVAITLLYSEIRSFPSFFNCYKVIPFENKGKKIKVKWESASFSLLSLGKCPGGLLSIPVRCCPQSEEEPRAMVGVGGEECGQDHLPNTCRDRPDLRLLLPGPELMES